MPPPYNPPNPRLYLHAAGTLLGSSETGPEWWPTPEGFQTQPGDVVKNGPGDYTVRLSQPVAPNRAVVYPSDHQVGEVVANEVFAYSRPDDYHIRIGVRNLAGEPVDIDLDVLVVGILPP